MTVSRRDGENYDQETSQSVEAEGFGSFVEASYRVALFIELHGSVSTRRPTIYGERRCDVPAVPRRRFR
jgi:hypothetical protein